VIQPFNGSVRRALTPTLASPRAFPGAVGPGTRTWSRDCVRSLRQTCGERRDQAHLPAEQPAPGQDPRLPSAHAHACRSRHPRGASPQGAHRALGLTHLPVLPATHRMRRSADFQQTVRRGARGGRGTLVAHLTTTTDPGPPAVGLVVSKAVGNAVTRNRVKRRLRALVAARLDGLPDGALLVVRAQPAAAAASSADLGHDLDRAVETACRRHTRRLDG